MDKSVIVSVRLPQSMVDALDDLTNKYSLHSRTHLIYTAVRLLMAVHQKGVLRRFLWVIWDRLVIDKLDFEYHHEHR